MHHPHTISVRAAATVTHQSPRNAAPPRPDDWARYRLARARYALLLEYLRWIRTDPPLRDVAAENAAITSALSRLAALGRDLP
jgi:hypothetical protein